MTLDTICLFTLLLFVVFCLHVKLSQFICNYTWISFCTLFCCMSSVYQTCCKDIIKVRNIIVTRFSIRILSDCIPKEYLTWCKDTIRVLSFISITKRLKTEKIQTLTFLNCVFYIWLSQLTMSINMLNFSSPLKRIAVPLDTITAWSITPIRFEPTQVLVFMMLSVICIRIADGPV